MVLIILRRDAPEVATLRVCGLCGPAVTTPIRDHLLVGSPGGGKQETGLCGPCGDVLDRMVQTYGSDLSVIIQAGQASAENLVSGPRKPDDTVVPTERERAAAVLEDVAEARQQAVRGAEAPERAERALKQTGQLAEVHDEPTFC